MSAARMTTITVMAMGILGLGASAASADEYVIGCAQQGLGVMECAATMPGVQAIDSGESGPIDFGTGPDYNPFSPFTP